MRNLLAQACGYPTAATHWKPLVLCLCMLLMSLDLSPALAQRFENAGLQLNLLWPRARPGSTYQGLIKALRRQQLHARLPQHLRQQMRRVAGRHWRREGFCAFAADGTLINCPRTPANEKHFGCGGHANGPPQILLSCLWHMGSGLPFAWHQGPLGQGGERKQLRQMLDLLPADALLVADAGYVGYDLLRELKDSGKHFLIRAGANIRLLSKLGWAVRERADTVYLWPSQQARGGSGPRQRRRRQIPPLPLRLIRLPTAKGKADVCLLTDLPATRLSQRQASVLYQMRWGVEVFYRQLKQKLLKQKLCSTAPRQAGMELDWALLGLWVAGLLAVEQLIRHRRDPLRLSVSAALRQIRRSLSRPARQADADLLERLGEAVKDGYRRKGPKSTRPWPRKRKQRPPGEPQITAATAEQVQQAQEFHPNPPPK